MRDLSDLGKLLVFAGLALVALGGLLMAVRRGALPQLPGDILWERGTVRVYVPLGSCLLLSALLSAARWAWSRWH